MKNIWSNFKIFLWLTLITGVAYPLFITLMAQFTMKAQADGSILYVNGRPIGAQLIGQKFENERYFWPRPSAIDYNPMPSGGSNLGPSSQKLKEVIEARKKVLFTAHESKAYYIPSELLFASGSGIDPHLSPAGAYYQIERIAKARNIEHDQDKIKKLVDGLIIKRALGFLGNPHINVLILNLALDQEFP